MKLYEISAQYQQAMNELDTLDLDKQVIADTMEGLKGDLQEKSKAVAAFIANRETEISCTKEAAKKLSDRAAAEQAKMDSLREYLLYNMVKSDISEIRSPDLLLKIKKNPPSLVIDDESKLDEYKNEVIKKTVSIDKKRIKAEIKEGKKVSGAHIEQNNRLEIK